MDPAAEFGGYDFVSGLACLHDLPLEPGLTRLAGMLRPGGVVGVIGLYRAVTLADFAIDAVAIPVKAAVGALKAARGRAGRQEDRDMPVKDAADSFSQIRSAARSVMPGAELRRRLYFRYSLRWQRPAV